MKLKYSLPNKSDLGKMENFITRANQMGAQKEPFFFLIDFEKLMPVILPLDECNNEQVYINLDDTFHQTHKFTTTHSFDFEIDPIPFSDYEKAFQIVQSAIHHGDSYLTNLCFPTKVKSDLLLKHIFVSSRAKFKLLYKDQFVVFSPEAFVEIQGNQIHTFPMKGTISATHPNAKKEILNDAKETAEHATIVDFLRNDLNIIGSNVKVADYRYIEKVVSRQRSLYQVSSKISGTLPENYQSQIGTILDKLTPAGSISGAPKKRTLEIIKEAEGQNRGYFTGIFGVFDGQNMKSAVAIRFLEKDVDHFKYWSGGGITSQSKAQEEYEEMISKVYVPIY